MSNVATNLTKVGTYLGYFTIQEHTTNVNNNKPSRTYEKLVFTKADGMETRDFKAMGDIVYGMYVNGNLVKIGKAGSTNGWAGRIGTYGVDPKGEATNRKIITHLKEDFTYETRVEVYGISVPRIHSEYFCPVTREAVSIELPQNHQVETHLTTEAEAEGTDLMFCTQKV
jgi:hypothetical protein